MRVVFNILSLVCLSFLAYTQPVKNIVFEGAGIRGVAYVGAIKELERRNMLATVENVGGTSAGAIAALTLALGYDAKAIEDIIYNTKLQKFNDGRFLFVGGIARLNNNYGWYRGKAFTKWLATIIEAKTGDANITFEQLHARGFRDLYVTGTSLNHQKLIVFSHETYPKMKIKDAVRISMSIPLWFEAVFIDSVGNVLNPKKAMGNFDVMVDGGLTGEYPIFMFDSLTTHGTRITNHATIGFRIDTPEQIKYDASAKGLAPHDITRFRNYVGACYSYVIENMNRASLTPADWQRSVSISSGNIGPKIRRLSLAEKDLLINNGEEAMQSFLTSQSSQ